MEQLLAIFCDIDDFCKAYEEYSKAYLLTDATQKNQKISMSMSEIMTIVVYFHLSNHKTFKWYYKRLICEHWADCFPKRLSYNRFVEVMATVTAPLTLYLIKCGFGKSSGINFLDSTPLDVCHNRRIHSHKVFDGLAARGKSSTGWFFGFKLHIVINDKGELLAFCLTPGNVDDRDWSVISKLTKELFGKVFADKGYICAELFEKLYERNITLVTKLKKNMKNKLMDISEKILLRKRAVVETVIDFLKNICQIEHARHRSFSNFFINLIAGLTAYCFLPKKPSIFSSLSSCLG